MQRGIEPAKVLPFFGQMLDGVEAAHLLDVWHRDLKPENVLHDISSCSGLSYLDGVVEQMIQQDPAARPACIGLIKEQLIARGNEFIGGQKLSQLKKQVIPECVIDDPFVTDLIRVKRIADYRDGRLVLELSAPPHLTGLCSFKGSVTTRQWRAPSR
jgi:hypothetical protein